ncbi:MAG: tfp pilus assembly protein major pilin [Frankiales bacterium]|nr:tfp pilus assembly protein major pilin [Frankiales bacterium]
MTKTTTRTDEAGFTLVELLVVITIISILAAIALPVFYGQRAKGYKAQMAADLHSVQTAEEAWSVNHSGGYTTDLTALSSEGFKASDDVTAHAKVVGTDYLVCTKSGSISTWLVFNSATGTTTSSATDCA